jgi:hypothetical protein
MVRLTGNLFRPVPAHRRRRVAWTDPAGETVRLAVHMD